MLKARDIPQRLMARYLSGERLTNDEREVLLFILYLESMERKGIAFKIDSETGEPGPGLVSGMPVRVKRLRSDAQCPKYAYDGDAGMDLYAVEHHVLAVGDIVAVPTGIALEVPRGLEAQVRSRSGMALRDGVFVLNSPGTIDSGYRGEVIITLARFGCAGNNRPVDIKPGQRIAQVVFSRHVTAELQEVSELSESARGVGGYGSTGA